MTEYSGGKFRKKKVNFSMISNEIIRDDTVSLKSKGLYALIQSYITLEDFSLYKGFLLSKCKEGKKAFDAAWKELKDAGSSYDTCKPERSASKSCKKPLQEASIQAHRVHKASLFRLYRRNQLYEKLSDNFTL